MAAPLPESLEHLLEQLARLPGIGRKTAMRLAFYIVNNRHELAPELARALTGVAERVQLCETCFNISEEQRCPVCSDERRSDEEICVVEGVPELMAVEQSGRFRGTYHVLHGLLSPMRGVGPAALRLDTLRRRCVQGVREVVVATSLTSDGETTALYIKKLLSDLSIQVTRLASGVPFGGSIEFTDSQTLSRALQDRRPI